MQGPVKVKVDVKLCFARCTWGGTHRVFGHVKNPTLAGGDRLFDGRFHGAYDETTGIIEMWKVESFGLDREDIMRVWEMEAEADKAFEASEASWNRERERKRKRDELQDEREDELQQIADMKLQMERRAKRVADIDAQMAELEG